MAVGERWVVEEKSGGHGGCHNEPELQLQFRGSVGRSAPTGNLSVSAELGRVVRGSSHPFSPLRGGTENIFN
jgi:hypothetical protein